MGKIFGKILVTGSHQMKFYTGIMYVFFQENNSKNSRFA